MRKSRGKSYVLSLLAAVLLMVPPVVCFSQNLTESLGQSKHDALPAPPKPLAPNCTAADFDASIQAAEGPNALYTLAINYRNISGHDCLLGQSSGPGLNPWTFPDGRIIHPCPDCLVPTPKRVHTTFAPFVLKKEETAHQAFSWITDPAGQDTSCLQLVAMSISIGQVNRPPYSLRCPALLKRVCSPLQYGEYAAGPFRENSPPAGLEVPTLELFQDSKSHYPGQQLELEGHVTEPTDLLPSSPRTCPAMLQRVRNPNGDTQWEQLSYKWCMPDHIVGHGPGGQIDFKIDAPQTAPGTHSFSLIQVLPAGENGDVALAESNTIHLVTLDNTTMRRHWGPLVRGIAVDVTLDKQAFALGEDVPLHIALENFSADDPVVGMTPLWDPGMVVTIDVLDANQNPIKRSDGRRYTGHGRWLTYEKGVVVPMEETLSNVGLLPTELGTFTVTVTWSPHTCTGPDCGRSGGVSGQPYATVQDTVSFDIVAGNHPQ